MLHGGFNPVLKIGLHICLHVDISLVYLYMNWPSLCGPLYKVSSNLWKKWKQLLTFTWERSNYCDCLQFLIWRIPAAKYELLNSFRCTILSFNGSSFPRLILGYPNLSGKRRKCARAVTSPGLRRQGWYGRGGKRTRGGWGEWNAAAWWQNLEDTKQASLKV